MKKINLKFSIITLMILLAAMSRLIPHPVNFAPIGGMALFGAAFYSKRYLAFLIPTVAMWLSDVVLNNVVYGPYFDRFVWFYNGSLFTYGALALTVLLGIFTLKKIRISNVILSALAASVIFFIVSNFGFWFASGMYPPTFAGLMDCYTIGLPFFQNTVSGDLAYTGALFGLYALCAKRFPELRPSYVFTGR